MTIYNVSGQRVRTLVDEYQSSGIKTMFWEGKNDQGKGVSSGIYFYKLKTGEYTEAKKMLLIR